MRRLFLALSAIMLLGGATSAPAAAQDRHWRDDRGRDERGRDERGRDDRAHDRGWNGGWRDHDIHRFHDYDVGLWRGGRWFEGRHDGRRGWWWVVGGAWYYYPAPVYPYPDPYRPPVVAGPPPPGEVYYFCPQPRGYYPYVAACPSGWQVVPAG